MVSLTRILEGIKDSPVSVRFIRERLPPNCRVVEYKSLKGKHRSQIFKNTEDSLIIDAPRYSYADRYALTEEVLGIFSGAAKSSK